MLLIFFEKGKIELFAFLGGLGGAFFSEKSLTITTCFIMFSSSRLGCLRVVDPSKCYWVVSTRKKST